MHYVTADLHGCPLSVLNGLLDKAGFTEADTLHVLGDVIDRGSEGVTLLRWIMKQRNVRFLRGNHEDMMLGCSFLLRDIAGEDAGTVADEELSRLLRWMYNGAEPTVNALRELCRKNKSAFHEVIEFVRDAPLYEPVCTDGANFILVHAGLGNFKKDKLLSEYETHDLVWFRPAITDRFFEAPVDGKPLLTVFGHTPTRMYGEEHKGKILRTDTWIDVDTGENPCLLRLEDMQPFYV